MLIVTNIVKQSTITPSAIDVAASVPVISHRSVQVQEVKIGPLYMIKFI